MNLALQVRVWSYLARHGARQRHATRPWIGIRSDKNACKPSPAAIDFFANLLSSSSQLSHASSSALARGCQLTGLVRPRLLRFHAVLSSLVSQSLPLSVQLWCAWQPLQCPGVNLHAARSVSITRTRTRTCSGSDQVGLHTMAHHLSHRTYAAIDTARHADFSPDP